MLLSRSLRSFRFRILGHFLLTQLLLPLLERAPQGRVINVSAHGYTAGKMNIEDPLNVGSWAPGFHARDAFSHSKLAIVLASRALAGRLRKGKSMRFIGELIGA